MKLEFNKNVPYKHPGIDYEFFITEFFVYTNNTGAMLYRKKGDLCAPINRIDIKDVDDFISKIESIKKQQISKQNIMEKKQKDIVDLREHLFAQIERLDAEDITDEKLEKEVKRAKAIKSIADSLIDTARVEIKYREAISGAKGSNFLESEQNKLN